MKILADTHTFLWFVTDAPQLSAKAKTLLEAQDTERFLSLASVWELAIKTSLGKLTLRKPLEEFLPEQLAAKRVFAFALNCGASVPNQRNVCVSARTFTPCKV